MQPGRSRYARLQPLAAGRGFVPRNSTSVKDRASDSPPKEDGNFQPYVTVLRDPQTKRFRMWYGVAVNASQSHLGYIESEDGIHWIRPHRVLDDPAQITFGASVLDDGERGGAR